jgi:hypothetical protein
MNAVPRCLKALKTTQFPGLEIARYVYFQNILCNDSCAARNIPIFYGNIRHKLPSFEAKEKA